MEILLSPPELSMSLNPIVYKVKTDNLQSHFLQLRLFIETYFESDDFEELVPLSLSPDKEGEGIFYLQGDLDKALRPDFPSQNGDETDNEPQLHRNICRRFRVETGEDGSVDYTDTKLVLKGGFSFAHFAERAEGELIPFNTTILTVRPRKRYISPWQREFLTWIFPKAGTYPITYRINYVDKNQPFEEYDIPVTVRAFEPVLMPSGFVSQAYDQKRPGALIRNITIGMLKDISYTVKTVGEKPIQIANENEGLVIRRRDGKSFISDDGLHDKIYPIYYQFKLMRWGGDPRNGDLGGHTFAWVFNEEDKSYISDYEIFIPKHRWASTPEVPEDMVGNWYAARMSKQGGSDEVFLGIFYGSGDSEETFTIPAGNDVITLIPYQDCTPNYHEFYWWNSLGAWDSVFTVGESKDFLEVKQEEFRHYYSHDYQAIDGEYQAFNTQARNSHKVHLGYRSQKELYALQDFFRAEIRLERINGKFYPIRVLNSKPKYYDSSSNLHTIEIEYQCAYDEVATKPVF